ncbi:MAG: ABC transporter ATP-binding protein [Thermoplasmata archaeon]
MSHLELHGVGFAYEDGTVALKSVGLAVEQGEKVAVIGPNAAGKSTLLHLIAGFRMPFQGRVVIGGTELSKRNGNELRKRVGLLFQDPDDQLFMPTVEEDVAFGPRNLGAADVAGAVAKGLRSTGVEALARRRPHRLSYGMKKRVALAGVMAMDPEILLLDEPTSGLDPRARRDLIRVLQRLDRTMLIATHDIEAAAEIVDRAVVLNVEVVAQGTVRDIIASPEVLESVGLEMPPLSKLFKAFDAMGYKVNSLPISIDQAVAELIRVMDEESRHLRTPIHNHEEGLDRGHRGRKEAPRREGG